VNPGRVAALHRELARIHAELAKELESEPALEAPPPPPPKSKPRKRRPAVRAEFTPPSDTDRAEARRHLRALGKLVEG
jgi:hypothetical protein